MYTYTSSTYNQHNPQGGMFDCVSAADGEISTSRHFSLYTFHFSLTIGRMYDPRLGMFMSADPVVQFPTNPLNYNRYSYVLNNPLKYTDPSGYQTQKDPIATPELINIDWLRHSPYFDYNSPFNSIGSTGGAYSIAGAGLNGNGLDGVYYDWSSNTYRFVDSGTPVSRNYVQSFINSNAFWGAYYVDGYAGSGEYMYFKGRSLKIVNNLNTAKGQGLNNPIEYIGVVNDITLSAAMGYNALDNGLKRKYAYKLSKKIDIKSGTIFQSAKSIGLKSVKVLGKTATGIAIGSIAYDFGTGDANTATLIDITLLVGGTAATILIGTAAAPYVIGIGVVYGVGCLMGFDDYINNQWDIEKNINFIPKK